MRLAGLVLALVLLILAAGAVWAGSVSFANLCPSYRLAVKAGDLLIYCPPQTAPWLTIKACARPRASRDAGGNLTVTCG
jgi:hypothetical protein